MSVRNAVLAWSCADNDARPVLHSDDTSDFAVLTLQQRLLQILLLPSVYVSFIIQNESKICDPNTDTAIEGIVCGF